MQKTAVLRFSLILLTVLLLAVGCEESGRDGVQQTVTVAPQPTGDAAEAPSPGDSTAVQADPYDKIVDIGESQTREGLELILDGIAIGDPSKVLNEQQSQYFKATYPGVRSIVIVQFEAVNTTATTSFLPVYTSTTALVNDEQVDIDFLLSEVEIEVLSGARVQMRAVFPVTRYTPDQIMNIRFLLEKTFSLTQPESETTYDFTVHVP